MESPQKIIVLTIDAQTESFLNTKLIDGFVIQSVTNLNPAVNGLLIVYALPPGLAE